MGNAPIHVVHTMYRLSTGGMENVVVQLINHLPRQRFRHSIMAITEVDPVFVRRIDRKDVGVVELRKPPGQPIRAFPRAYRVLRDLRPDVFHSCNLAALEFVPTAFAAGVRRRVHVEHGWDVSDPDGSNRSYQLIRRMCKPFVNEFVAVSVQLHEYLRKRIGVPEQKLHLVHNGVDIDVFRPHSADDLPPPGYPFRYQDHWVVGTVGRLARIKNQTLLAQAFVLLARSGAPGVEQVRLAIVGEGELRPAIRAILDDAGLAESVWMPGARDDIASILRALDCFVLPSIAEGTSCTLQEAMATALPIVATDVGGNGNLLDGGRIGELVPPGDAAALASAMGTAFAGRGQTGRGHAARLEAERKYALGTMVNAYESLFSGRA